MSLKKLRRFGHTFLSSYICLPCSPVWSGVPLSYNIWNNNDRQPFQNNSRECPETSWEVSCSVCLLLSRKSSSFGHPPSEAIISVLNDMQTPWQSPQYPCTKYPGYSQTLNQFLVSPDKKYLYAVLSSPSIAASGLPSN